MGKLNVEKMKKTADVVLNVLIWIVVAFSLLVTVLVFSAQGSADGVPSLFGKSLITIETGSMEPTYNSGDLVFMTKLTDEEKANLQPGNIITYYAPIDINQDGVKGDINTHRIVSIDKETMSIKTRGDNKETNTKDDDYVIGYSDVIGICTEDEKISGLGNVIRFLSSSLGFFLCIVLPLALFFIYELYNFIRLLVTEKAKNAPVSADVEEEIKKKAIEEYLKQQAARAEEAKQPDENT